MWLQRKTLLTKNVRFVPSGYNGAMVGEEVYFTEFGSTEFTLEILINLMMIECKLYTTKDVVKICL